MKNNIHFMFGNNLRYEEHLKSILNAIEDSKTVIHFNNYKHDNHVHILNKAKECDREKDVLFINFIPGQDKPVTNTYNPFLKMSPNEITDMIMSCVWSGESPQILNKTRSLINVIANCLCDLRDNYGMHINAEIIRRHITLKSIINFKHNVLINKENINKVENYLEMLDDYNDKLFYEQSVKTQDCHGYSEFLLNGFLGVFGGALGHISCANTSDIDMKDVLLNNKILVIMMPHLEKSGDEISNLYKIVFLDFLNNFNRAKIHSSKKLNLFLSLEDFGYTSFCKKDIFNMLGIVGVETLISNRDIVSMRRLCDENYNNAWFLDYKVSKISETQKLWDKKVPIEKFVLSQLTVFDKLKAFFG